MTIANRDVFETINVAVNEAIRKRFGAPDTVTDNMPAMIAVATLQLSLRYFAETQAPKQVVRDFFEKLMDGEEEKKPIITQDGNRLILPGQRRRG